MNYFHCHMKICKRSIGRSAVAASAYINRARLENTWDGTVRDYTRKGDLVYSEVFLPAHAPPEYANREVLWNSVEWNEKKRNAQLARVIELALPAELTHEQNIELIRKYVQDTFVSQGMIADVGFHDKGDGNPHVHIMLTMRPVNEDGTWAGKGVLMYKLDENGNRIPGNQKGRWQTYKLRMTDWDDRGNGELWRESAARHINDVLREAGFTQGFVDHRSYRRQGVDKVPTVHEGPEVRAMEKRGIRTELGDINRDITKQNKQLEQMKARLARLNAYAQHEKKIDETLIAQGRDPSDPNLRFLLANQIYSRSTESTKRQLKDVSGMLAVMKDYNITDAASLADAVKQENQKYYDLRSKIDKNRSMSMELIAMLEAYNNSKEYRKIYRRWDSLTGADQTAYWRQHEYELRKFSEAEEKLQSLEDAGVPIDIKQWKATLDYLSKEAFALNYQLNGQKETIRRLEVVKREMTHSRKGRDKHQQER